MILAIIFSPLCNVLIFCRHLPRSLNLTSSLFKLTRNLPWSLRRTRSLMMEQGPTCDGHVALGQYYNKMKGSAIQVREVMAEIRCRASPDHVPMTRFDIFRVRLALTVALEAISEPWSCTVVPCQATMSGFALGSRS